MKSEKPRAAALRPPQKNRLKSTFNKDIRSSNQEKRTQSAFVEEVQKTSPEQAQIDGCPDSSLPLQQNNHGHGVFVPFPYNIVSESNQKPNIVYFDIKSRSYRAALTTADEALLLANSVCRTAATTESKPEECIIKEGVLKQNNGLSYIHRSMQTNHWPMKERNIGTESKQLKNATTSCSTWEIYDAYQSNSQGSSADKESSRVNCMLHSLKVIERMLFQNINKDILYWDDPADVSRPDEGTLLPLWTIHPENAHARSVTAIAWSSKHPDLLAIAFGSFNVNQCVAGMLCIFSLANTNNPESQIILPSGILSVDFHPRMPFLLALGCQNGSVHIVNAATSSLIASCSLTECHADPVWHVKWTHAISAAVWQFMSLSSDGYLVHWEIHQGKEIHRTSVLSLHPAQNDSSPSPPSSFSWKNYPSASCFDVHPFHSSIVLIGTHEGNILRCSTDIGPRSIESYHTKIGNNESNTTNNVTSTASAFPIYTVAWNALHPSSFLTASFDWNIRIWDSFCPDEEIFSFDAGSPVADASWSPWSSTSFAAATEGGKVVVYDLGHSTDFPLCKQKIVHKTKLTKIKFHPIYPIIVVGDEKGSVMCFKLSPNLRRQRHGNGVAVSGSKGEDLVHGTSMHDVLKVGTLKRLAEKMGYTRLSSTGIVRSAP